MERLEVTPQGFVTASTRRPVFLFGAQYGGRDLPGCDAWWETDADAREQVLEMRAAGLNVLRIWPPFEQLMAGPGRPVAERLDALADFVAFCEQAGMYLAVTLNQLFVIERRPAWYARAAEADRWRAMADHAASVAQAIGHSPAVVFYDLINEPFSVGFSLYPTDTPPFGFSQALALAADVNGRDPAAIVASWVATMRAAIARFDPDRPVTIGRHAIFGPGHAEDEFSVADAALDLLCVHQYVTDASVEEDLRVVEAFAARARAVGRPLVLGETGSIFGCEPDTLLGFWRRVCDLGVAGIISYWSGPRAERPQDGSLGALYNWQTTEALYRAPEVLALTAAGLPSDRPASEDSIPDPDRECRP